MKRQHEIPDEGSGATNEDQVITKKQGAKTPGTTTKSRTQVKGTKPKTKDKMPVKKTKAKVEDKTPVKKTMVKKVQAEAEQQQHLPIITRTFSKGYEEKAQELGISTEVSQLHLPSSSGMALKNEIYHRTGIVTRSMLNSTAIPVVAEDDNNGRGLPSTKGERDTKDVACSTDYKTFVEACTQVDSDVDVGTQFEQQPLSERSGQPVYAYELDPCIVDVRSRSNPFELPECFESEDNDMDCEPHIQQDTSTDVELSHTTEEDLGRAGGDRLETASQLSGGFETSVNLEALDSDSSVRNKRIQTADAVKNVVGTSRRHEPYPQQATGRWLHRFDLGGTFWRFVRWYNTLRN